ncbi:RHS repeat-associated core domain-containing protein [Amycolatopsis sp. NBC_01286]|uniref:RHS repeat-associated core domain-containing protein n=1 Tax=Amycolatopsis sp. NBC_01286 TaxID=2903560 RepID=UPI002E10C576|nr:hypothetical protein OG570_40610 [Amycolatopsis sp. NBC_01286]
MAVTRRWRDPYGTTRGTPPSTWPDKHGFLGGYQNTTGVTHIGARDYDPLAGRFMTADPVLDPSNPQALNAYSYGNNNPMSLAGLRNLESLSFLDDPVVLTFRNCRELEILSQLARWSESLTRLQVSACPVEDWSPLAQLTRLRSLEIGATQSVDLSLLSDVQTLEELSLDSNQVDLSPLAGRRGLTVWIKSAAEVSGEDMLGPGSQIGRY